MGNIDSEPTGLQVDVGLEVGFMKERKLNHITFMLVA